MNSINKAALILLSLILILPCFTRMKISTPNSKVVVQGNNPILFLHCWNGDASHWITMKKEFQNDGWSNNLLYAYTFDDPSNPSVQANTHKANQMKQWVDTILNASGAEKIDLVGHCLGALISRYYIKFLGGIDLVDDYVSLAGPHHGEKTYNATTIDHVFILNEGDETPGGRLNDTIGEHVDPIWDCIYNSTHIPGNISYTSIYSLNDSIIPYNSSMLDGAINIPVVGVSHMQMHSAEGVAWKVYEKVRAAVDDQNSTFPMRTTSTTTTTNTAGLGSLSLLVAMVFLIPWYKRKK
jgi:hypothetical protein